MSGHSIRVVLVALAAVASVAQAPPPTPAPHAPQAPPTPSAAIALQGAGPYHRLTLPLAIYGHAPHGDLSDLRVQNAAGPAVPYPSLRNEAAAPRTASQAVPIFAFPGNASSGDTAMVFTVRPDGSLALAGKPAAKASEATQWLIDVSQVKG